MPNAPNIAIEVAAVRANLSDWTESGDALLLDRARREYAAELDSFREWQRHNPEKKSWRNRPPTRTQIFLINRNATRLGIDAPFNLDRGDAHDWIEAHGGNLRLADTVVDEAPGPCIGQRQDVAGRRRPGRRAGQRHRSQDRCHG